MGNITSSWFRKISSKRTLFATENGNPLPLGATITPRGINFSVFSQQAVTVTLVLLRLETKELLWEVELNPKCNKTGNTWHIHILGITQDVLYGYRINSKSRGSHEKGLLLDPYTRAISDGKVWGQREHRYSCVTENRQERHTSPLTPIRDTVMYEVHVRGFTRHPSSDTQAPGTFLGMIEKIPYLKDLGITAVELLPICEFDETNNSHLNPATGERLKNFWGYNTIGFFVPKASYASRNHAQEHLSEFKELVLAMHKAEIEVILDIVFNHTGEGDKQGPVIHFKGLSNSVYYILGPDGNYLNFSGCGNTLSCNHPVVSDLLIDCLRYWVVEMNVDGFRFDLASIMTRGKTGEVLNPPPVLERISKDPVLANTKLIAEPWDCGVYQVGTFPGYGNWSEWNDKFRDDVRSFLKGDNGKSYSMAMRIVGSPDLYYKYDRNPHHGVNFVTCHDGFTLNDLVSYNHKHNEDNGEQNRDGSDNNNSWNCGVEGPTEDSAILYLRKMQMKNFLAILFLAHGIPMLLAGDEFARTQRGNNNAYCQDNEISWINWSLSRRNRDLLRFTREMIAFRRRHRVLSTREFIATPTLEGHGIQWHGVKLHQPDWGFHSHTLAFLLEGNKALEGDDDIYVAINAYWQHLPFEIPPTSSGKVWHLLVDTAKPDPQDIVPEIQEKREMAQAIYQVAAHSLIILVACR